ncbi:MAG: biopolymer transporter ExbD [Candidatus Omnitrophica bacterium]|nr:biopolymer transporter ExbD [Candidatus Omnitrophota bacterium]MBU2043842.1 biopolymer transporter ExbD [Candidatus Omnitrophota bacterium]MBU2251364.1 biopolymer transporter ExbD [Candidatus Omnitrophota bacterium]MBU2266267.1 biopolymer transporter ExbD [Candidatus Omnitrophota bacterium]MBU2473809.1 biopolymer transporter ExbD [Candidatus Omnitrophota bacterium]
MRFKKRARIEAGLRQIDIVPLIDCMFLLLVFFMLTSNFVVIPGVNIQLPKVLTAESVDTRTLTIIISSEDIIYVEDKPQSIKDTEAMIKKGKFSSIFIKADRDASFGIFAKIYDICKRLEIGKISYATTYDE